MKKNKFIFAGKNGTDVNLRIAHILWLPYHFIKALLRGDGPFFLGFFTAFIQLPNVIQSAFKAEKLFVKHDHEVINNYSRL